VRKQSSFPIVLVLGLILSACATEVSPASPATILPTVLPASSATPTAGPSTVRGGFVLTNTGSPGVEAGIETMSIQLEYRPSTTGPWNSLEAECSFDPPAPLVLKTKLTVQYECESQSTPPENAELRAIVEVKLFGVDQPYQMEIAAPDSKD
jgi:hypothetical protein